MRGDRPNFFLKKYFNMRGSKGVRVPLGGGTENIGGSFHKYIG